MQTIHAWSAPVLLGGALLLAPMTPALAQAPRDSMSQSARKVQQAASQKLKYIGQVIRLDETQIALGRIALTRSDNVRVHRLAQTMIDTHTRHLQSLGAWARARAQELRVSEGLQPSQGVGGAGMAGTEDGMQPPDQGTGGAGVDTGLAGLAGTMEAYAQRAEQHRAVMTDRFADLMKETGNRFDRDWVKAVRDTQNDGMSLIRDGVDRYASDASFASLLTRTEPILQKNLRAVDQISTSIQ